MLPASLNLSTQPGNTNTPLPPPTNSTISSTEQASLENPRSTPSDQCAEHALPSATDGTNSEKKRAFHHSSDTQGAKTRKKPYSLPYTVHRATTYQPELFYREKSHSSLRGIFSSLFRTDTDNYHNKSNSGTGQRQSLLSLPSFLSSSSSSTRHIRDSNIPVVDTTEPVFDELFFYRTPGRRAWERQPQQPPQKQPTPTTHRGSTHSLEVISPRALYFSEPSLRSYRSCESNSTVSNTLSRHSSMFVHADHNDSEDHSSSVLPEMVQRWSSLPSSLQLDMEDNIEWQKHYSRSMSSSEEGKWEDSIFEPFADQKVTRSMSEVLFDGETADMVDRPRQQEEPNHSDERKATIAELTGHSRYLSSVVPKERPSPAAARICIPGSGWCIIFRGLLPYLDEASMEAFSLTCQAWNIATIPWLPAAQHQPPFRISGNPPASVRLPVELLHMVFNHLAPQDFNSARHTCQVWMRASLDPGLLANMLRRGGWWSAAMRDLTNAITSSTTNEKDKGCLDDIKLFTDATATTTTIKLSDYFSEAWFLSRRLSRECSLAPGWKGSGLRKGKLYTQEQSSYLPYSSNGGVCDLNAMMLVRQGRLPNQENGQQQQQSGIIATATGPPLQVARLPPWGLVFAHSICGRFVLVAEAEIIYVHELIGQGAEITVPDLRLITSIICPGRVLAMSMDATSKRFAIAALLEERMGLVFELELGERAPAAPTTEAGVAAETAAQPPPPLPKESGYATTDQGVDIATAMEEEREKEEQVHKAPPAAVSNNNNNMVCFTTTHLPSEYHLSNLDSIFSYSTLGEYLEPISHIRGSSPRSSTGSSVFSSINFREGSQEVELRSVNDERSHEHNLINRAWALRLTACEQAQQQQQRMQGGHEHGNFTRERRSYAPIIEIGQRSLYKHICSEEDPPRSVAMCPQRRCVAFGCSSGIELYWVDALSRQDLNRWFPLTAPSDHLYFLPPRHGVDSYRKLRLISSAAHPTENAATLQRMFSPRPSAGTGHWHSYAYNKPTWYLPAIQQKCDHYQAIPLTDGYHILFTDPETGSLALGSDAPLGSPTKLLRKIMFLPPGGESMVAVRTTPRLYAAASKLDWGVRIVAGYGNTIVLYSVPPDMFVHSQAEQFKLEREEFTDIGESELIKDMVNYWALWWRQNNRHPGRVDAAEGTPASMWPLHVKGVVVGYCDDLEELVINYSPELTIWAFSSTRNVLIWQVSGGEHPLQDKAESIVPRGNTKMRNQCASSERGERGDGNLVTTISDREQKSAEPADWDEEADTIADGCFLSSLAEPSQQRQTETGTERQSQDRRSVAEQVQEVGEEEERWVDDDGDLVMVDAEPSPTMLPSLIPRMRRSW